MRGFLFVVVVGILRRGGGRMGGKMNGVTERREEEIERRERIKGDIP